jgi:hypothetical protein
VEECASILTAERVYTGLLADPETICVGRRGEVRYNVGDRTVTVQFEVRANAVWRFGRVFLTCSMCSGRATRIYLPSSTAPAGCRRCLGLSYDSRKADYRTTGPWGKYLGSWAEASTILANERRSTASEARYAERRLILGKVGAVVAGLPSPPHPLANTQSMRVAVFIPTLRVPFWCREGGTWQSVERSATPLADDSPHD